MKLDQFQQFCGSATISPWVWEVAERHGEVVDSFGQVAERHGEVVQWQVDFFGRQEHLTAFG
jgi:hypothetical protein